MTFPLTIVEPGIGQWRSADLDEEGLPTDLRFHEDPAISPLGAVFDGRVTRVDTTLDMAFLDLGEGRTGVLNFRRARLLVKGQVAAINDCVHEGQMVRVQVIAEPSALEDKALPVTPRPRLAGRYVVVESGKARLNLSKDLSTRETKDLKEAIGEITEEAAVIVRARAGGVAIAAVKAEVDRLVSALTKPAGEPGLLFSWSPCEKALLETPDTETPVLVEGSDYADVKAMAAQVWPDLHARIAPYEGKGLAFEEYGVNEAIEEALAPRIDLPSGGWISFHTTPALMAVDVNMGSALKHMAAGEAKLVTNMEATLATAYHLRFQDIGGIIVIDYINMTGKGHNRELMQLVERTFRADKVPVQHTGISAFGLVEVTRKRSGLSLRDRMRSPRPDTDRVLNTALHVLLTALQAGKSAEPGALLIVAEKPVINWLNTNHKLLSDLSDKTARQVTLKEGAVTEAYIQPAE